MVLLPWRVLLYQTYLQFESSVALFSHQLVADTSVVRTVEQIVSKHLDLQPGRFPSLYYEFQCRVGELGQTFIYLAVSGDYKCICVHVNNIA